MYLPTVTEHSTVCEYLPVPLTVRTLRALCERRLATRQIERSIFSVGNFSIRVFRVSQGELLGHNSIIELRKRKNF